MTTIEIHKLLSSVLEIEAMMIAAGAEIYRAEESARRILEAYGMQQADVYATTSNIIVSVETADGTVKTHTRRVPQIATDIEKVHRLNDLVRRLSATPIAVEHLSAEIDAVRQTPQYPTWVVTLFYGVIAAAFYLFFGGRHLLELSVSFGAGIITGLLTFGLDKVNANKFLVKFLCAFCACVISFTLKRLHCIESVDYIIIGNIMTLIPGIGLTNSLRDLFSGDSISGVLRLIEAALLALAIACGYIVTTFLFGGAA